MSLLQNINLWLIGAIAAGGAVRIAACFIKMIFDAESAGEQTKRIKNTIIFVVLAATVDAAATLAQHYFL